MQRMVVKIVSLAMLVALASMALGQAQPGVEKAKNRGLFGQGSTAPKPGTSNLFDDKGKPLPKSDNLVTSSLESLLSLAMQNNPDIRVAEAKVREAEAELHRIWVQVAQKVIALHHSIEAQKPAVAAAESEYKRLVGLYKQGATPVNMVHDAQVALEAAKAKLATLEAEMPSLLGKLPQALGARGSVRWGPVRSDMLGSVIDPADLASGFTFSADKLHAAAARRFQLALDSGELFSAKPPIAGSMADRIRKALETPITADYGSKSLQDVLKDLEQKTPGITFLTRGVGKIQLPLTFRFTEATPLSAVFQALEDAAAIRIAVREYGFFVTSLGLPEGYLSIDEFLKSRPGGNKPKATDVEGVVKSIDQNTGYLTIDIGSSAGVSEAQILDVYRVKPQPKYLGKIRIVAVRPNQSVAEQAMAHPQEPDLIQVGDQVTGRIRTSGRE